jgi:hypothetical protein
MKKIKIDNEVYNVPQSWEDITLNQYETFYTFKADGDKIQEIMLVSKVSIIPFNVLADLPLSFYTEILNTILFIFKSIKYKPVSYVKDDEGNTYYVNTKEELTLRQYVDIESTFEEEGNENRLAEILGIVCLKPNEKYRSEILSHRKELFGNMNMDKIFPILTFFLRCNERLESLTQLYSNLQGIIEQFRPNTKPSPKDGDGKR